MEDSQRVKSVTVKIGFGGKRGKTRGLLPERREEVSAVDCRCASRHSCFLDLEPRGSEALPAFWF